MINRFVSPIVRPVIFSLCGRGGARFSGYGADRSLRLNPSSLYNYPYWRIRPDGRSERQRRTAAHPAVIIAALYGAAKRSGPR